MSAKLDNKMKILFVGDNRDRQNWGCRATSMALGALLLEKGAISATVQGKEIGSWAMTPIYWGGMWPSSFFRGVDSFPSKYWQKVVKEVKSFLGIIDDFIDLDPLQSCRNFDRIWKRYPFLRLLHKNIEEADALIINGEGSYIFSTPPRRDTLFYNFILAYAQRSGKKTYVLNTMISDCTRTPPNQLVIKKSLEVLQKCEAVSVRDPVSKMYMEKYNFSGNIFYFPDALFTWADYVPNWSRVTGKTNIYEPFGKEEFRNQPEINLDFPYICLSGSSRAAWDQKAAKYAYGELARELMKLGKQLLLVPTCPGDRFLEEIGRELNIPSLPLEIPIRVGAVILGKADAFVSGRYHPSILASNGGTPCVLLGSNSHKTLSLQNILGYEHPSEFPAIPSVNDIRDIICCVENALDSSSRPTILESIRCISEQAKKVVTLIE